MGCQCAPIEAVWTHQSYKLLCKQTATVTGGLQDRLASNLWSAVESRSRCNFPFVVKTRIISLNSIFVLALAFSWSTALSDCWAWKFLEICKNDFQQLSKTLCVPAVILAAVCSGLHGACCAILRMISCPLMRSPWFGLRCWLDSLFQKE